jgi:hypothetical protein
MKSPIIAVLPASNPITVGELHGLVCPPHCNARSRQQSELTNNKVPIGSILRNFRLRGRSRYSFGDGLILRKIDNTRITTAPMGRLQLNISSSSKLAWVNHLHPKAPSPGEFFREHAAKGRANAGGDSKHADDNSHVHRPFLQWYNLSDSTQGTLQ